MATTITAVGATFTLHCTPSRRLASSLTFHRRELGNRVRACVDAEDRDEGPARLADLKTQIKTLRGRVRDDGLELARHVAHCTDGCTRTSHTQPGLHTYDRAPHTLLPDLPPMADVATQLTQGATLDQVAATYQRTSDVIRIRLNRAGYDIHGQPTTTTARPRPEPVPLQLHPTKPPDWAERSLCAQTDPEAFFPDKDGTTRHAKQVCAGCTVRAECLDWALTHHERFGIWGGLSERERRKVEAALHAQQQQDTQEAPTHQEETAS